MQRIKSGIPGLDELIEGGFVKGHQILLAGETGTGKTTFACQFLLEGARNSENCLYLTLEESKESILKNMRRFSWSNEFEEFVKKNKIKIVRYLPISLQALTEKLTKIFREKKYERFVLDSLTIAAMGWEELKDLSKLRRNLFSFSDILRQFGITSLLLSEIEKGKDFISKYGFEEFVVDAVLLIKSFEFAIEDVNFSIIKMRGTNHSRELFKVVIDNNGLKIVKKEVGIVI